MRATHRNILVIGGTSGLGLEIALLLSKEGPSVFVTGRKNPGQKNLIYLNLDITSDAEKLSVDLDRVIERVKLIHLLVYAAGFYQENLISNLSNSDITSMINVGLLAPALLLQKILHTQNELPEFIAITSTSQWIPRLKEPLYAAVKAGLAALAHSVSLDSRVAKVLVIGPAGMKTKFCKGAKRENNSTLLNPKWIAERILELNKDNFKYQLVRILRDPPRVELVEQE